MWAVTESHCCVYHSGNFTLLCNMTSIAQTAEAKGLTVSDSNNDAGAHLISLEQRRSQAAASIALLQCIHRVSAHLFIKHGNKSSETRQGHGDR